MRSRQALSIVHGFLGFMLCGVLLSAAPVAAQDPAPAAGPGELKAGPGAELVSAHCGACHGLALVTQNRGDAAHWLKLIHWMQAEHNLWDLGAAEEPIVSYLATQYGAPERAPRRAPLRTTWRDRQPDER